MMQIVFRFAAGLLGLAALAAQAQSPQAAPGSAPLRLVVPFSAGTGIDLIARTVGPKLAERLGRPVVVENRIGASGNIGTEVVVRAPANNSTLLVTVNALVMNRSLYPQLPFDPIKDLMPVSLTSWGQLLLVTHPKSGFTTAGELIAAAKLRPGAINYASPGVGTPHHLAMELFKTTNGIFLTHIPYRSTGPALTDMLGGQVDVGFLPIHVALPHLRTGRLVALAIGSEHRHALLPQLPTLYEAHAGKINTDMWYGIFAPAATSAEFVAQINRELREILATPEVRAVFVTQGMDPATSTPEEFKRLVEQDAERWARVIKTQHITAQ